MTDTDSPRLSRNAAARRGGFVACPPLSAAAMDAAAAAIAGWSGYAPTPLQPMPGLAAQLGVASVALKLEAARFAVGSFKALGPPYALERALARAGGGTGWRAVAATSGNHGRALAWGARRLGGACTIFMPAHTSAGRAAAIAALGADVVRVPGDFDASLAAAVAAAERDRHLLVADLPFRGSTAIGADILAGYAVLGREIAAQAAPPPTHLFVAAGNGSLAGAVAAALARAWGAARPLVCAVEPLASDAVRRSLAAGHPVDLAESSESLMDGLVVRAPSRLAWPLLMDFVDAGLAISDAAALAGLRAAARGAWGDAPVAIGETGIAALAGLVVAAGDASIAAALGLGRDSRAIAIACEGVTDAAVFEALLATSR